MTNDQKKAVLAGFQKLAAEGKTAYEIAELLSVPLQHVRKLCSATGTKLKRANHRINRNVYSSRAFAVLAAVFHGGVSDAEISRRFGCTREFVSQIHGWMNTNKVVKV